MEYLYQFLLQEQLPAEISWLETLPVNHQSAFVPYLERPIKELGFENGKRSKNQNMNKRMMEFSRRNWNNAKIGGREPEKERSYKHMICERTRREKQKQGYIALHSLLPLGTKRDKKSIIQMTAEQIKELERYKQELQRGNQMLEANLAAKQEECAKIKLSVPYPSSSGVDSMIEVIKCLKDFGVNSNRIQSQFSIQEFSAELEFKTQIELEEVEKAVQRTVIEAERKLGCYFQEGRWKGVW